MPTYAPVAEYPKYGRYERGKIAGLIRRREQLLRVEGYGHLIKREIDAFSWALCWLKGSIQELEQEHIDILSRRRDFLTNKVPKNDYDKHEWGALTWLLDIVEVHGGNSNSEAHSN